MPAFGEKPLPIALAAGALLLLSAASCADAEPDSRLFEDIVVVTLPADGGFMATVWHWSAAGPKAVARARWEEEDARLHFAHIGEPSRSRPAPQWRGAVTPLLLHLTVSVAYRGWQDECGGGTCARAMEPWPAGGPLAFETFGLEDAKRLLPFRTAPAVDLGAVTSCGDFPRYEGDGICTGWFPHVSTATGNARSVMHCCRGHDQCYFGCPLLDDDQCRGTPCINRCNTRIGRCCEEAGGDVLQCGTYEYGSSFFGGGGRNGCGRAKAEAYCEDLLADGCDGERCQCEQCAELFEGDFECGECSCEDECDADEAAACMTDGRGDARRACEVLEFDPDTRCRKWTESRCTNGGACLSDDEGAMCVERECPAEHQCPDEGEREAQCDEDDTGTFFRECAYDADGCRSWRRVYCDDVECADDDDGPSCSGPPT